MLCVPVLTALGKRGFSGTARHAVAGAASTGELLAGKAFRGVHGRSGWPRKPDRCTNAGRRRPKNPAECTNASAATPRNAVGCTPPARSTPRITAECTNPTHHMPRKTTECTNAGPQETIPQHHRSCTEVQRAAFLGMKTKIGYSGRSFSAGVPGQRYSGRSFSAGALGQRYSGRLFSAGTRARRYSGRDFADQRQR